MAWGGGTRGSIIPVVLNRKSELLRTCRSREFWEETGGGHQDKRWIMRPDCFFKTENSIKKSIIHHRTPHKSMFSSTKPVVENTEENRQICRKYCTICQNYKRHSLEKYQPTELFCGCGTSSAPSMKEIGAAGTSASGTRPCPANQTSLTKGVRMCGGGTYRYLA